MSTPGRPKRDQRAVLRLPTEPSRSSLASGRGPARVCDLPLNMTGTCPCTSLGRLVKSSPPRSRTARHSTPRLPIKEQPLRRFCICAARAYFCMTDGKLSREQVRRRILDNLSWGNLPYRVIEPLPPLAVPHPPPRVQPSASEKPPERPRAPAKQLARKLITSIPFLGRAAIVLMTPLLLPLSIAGALATRLHSALRRIDNLIR
jgi:hypothetical protein